MPLRTTASLLVLLLVAGCSGVETAIQAVADAANDQALSDLWSGLPNADPGNCDADFSTFYDFGARDLACQGAAALAPSVLVSRAPVQPFQSGPHTVTAQSFRLDLTSERAFGRYNPAFVRWVTRAAVTTDPTGRQFIQPIYDAHVARSARIFWLAYESLASDGFPRADLDGRLGDYAAFLRGGPITDQIQGFNGGESVSTYQFIEDASPLLPMEEAVIVQNGERFGFDRWEIQEEASTALAFWLRRDVDGTADAWRSGLRGMLAAYDADWLARHGG